MRIKQLATIKVHYAADETGSAELLGGRVARIVATPVFGDLCRNAIVHLDRDPSAAKGIPAIAEVLYSPYPYRSNLSFANEVELVILLNILAIVGADAQAIYMPRDDEPGLMLVSHQDFLDPKLLAVAIGIDQPDEEDCEDDQEDDAVSAAAKVNRRPLESSQVRGTGRGASPTAPRPAFGSSDVAASCSAECGGRRAQG